MTTLRPIAAMCAGVLAVSPATADLNDILDRIPANAPLYVAVNDTEGLATQVRAFLGAVGQAEAGQMVGMSTGLIQTPGLGSGAAAFVLTEPFNPLEGGEPEGVILLEVDDFGQMVESFGGKPAGGSAEISLFGQDFHARDLGGNVVALAPDRDLVQGFVPGDGLAKAHRDRLGALADMLFENHALIVTNMPTVADGLGELAAEARAQAAGFAAMAGPQGAVFNEDLLWEPATVFLRDAQATAIGLTFSAKGVSLDVASNFKKGSFIAGFFQDTGDTDGLLAKVPTGSFLFASATDTRSEGLQKLNEAVAAFNLKLAEATGQGDTTPPDPLEVENARGEVFMIGENPQGLMGGMLTRATRYVETKEAGAVLANAASTAAELTKTPAKAGPFNVTMQWDANAYTSGDVAAARWSMTMTPAPGDPAAFQAQQGLQLMYGPTGGPAGFVAAIDGGVVQTFSAGNTALLDQAINAARNGGGLGAGDALGVARTMLPKNKVVEYYTDIDTFMGGILPLVGMFAGPLPFEAPGELAPVGGSVTTGGGGVSLRIAVPSDVAKWFIETAQALEEQGALDGAGGAGNAPPRF